MRGSVVKKKTGYSACWGGKCGKWTCRIGMFLRRCFCEQLLKDIWKVNGSSGCDFESRTVSGTGAAALEKSRITARRARRPTRPPVESSGSATTARALRPGFRGFESGHTLRIGSRAQTVPRATDGKSLCGAILRAADALRNLATAPLVKDSQSVPGIVSKAIPLFCTGRAGHGFGLYAGRTCGALRSLLRGRAASG